MFKKAIFVFKSLLSKHLSMCKRSQSYIIRKILFVVDFKEKDEKTTYFFYSVFCAFACQVTFSKIFALYNLQQKGER